MSKNREIEAKTLLAQDVYQKSSIVFPLEQILFRKIIILIRQTTC